MPPKNDDVIYEQTLMMMRRIIGWKRRCLFDKSQTLDTVEENKEKCRDLDTSCETYK